MENRCTVKYALIIFPLIVGIYFVFSRFCLAETTVAMQNIMGSALLNAYDTSAVAGFSEEDRTLILQGIRDEGIPARVTHHGTPEEAARWMHDSREQSVPVYAGVATWEQGIYEYARGDHDRAFMILGHMLHLVIDAHPLAASVAVSAAGAFPGTWRVLIKETAEYDQSSFIREGTEIVVRFLVEAHAAEEKAHDDAEYRASLQPRTVYALPQLPVQSIVAVIRHATKQSVSIVRDGAHRFTIALTDTFARLPPLTLGGAPPPIPTPPSLAHAQEFDTPLEAPTKKSFLPLALSIAALSRPLSPSPSLAELVLPHVSTTAPSVSAIPLLPESVKEHTPSAEQPVLLPPRLPLLPVPPAPAVDYLGFPVGFIPHAHDTTPPETTITASPPAMNNSSTTTFAFASNESGTFLCAIDEAPEIACASPHALSELSEGQHIFSVRAKDPSGNIDATPAVSAWTIDRTAPDTTLTQSPLSLVSTSSATFTFGATESGATFGYTIDGGAWNATVSPLVLTNLADGEHTVTIRAIDAAENIDPTPSVFSWVIDTTAPSTPVLASPIILTTTLAAVTLIGEREADATILVNGSSDGVTTPTATTWQKDITLPLGMTTFTATATDLAGNLSAPLTATLTHTVNQPPTAMSNLAITTPITTNDRLTLTWTAPTDVDIPAQALSYAFRYATTPIIDEATWNAATSVSGFSAVGAPGSATTFTVTGLSPATTYFFALRTSDGELLSALSNSPSGTTHYGVRITDAHFQGGVSVEYMTIKNERSDAQNLQGWTLFDDASTPHTYPFGAFTLAAGATVTVHTVPVGIGTDTATDLYWHRGSAVWNDDHDKAFLKDSGGILIDSVSW